jgi:hypothetical protein
MAISRMQQQRQMYYGGGLGSLQDPRQGYKLGKFVKKAIRAVKKVASSPIGKAALLYAGGAYLGGSTALGGAGGSFMSRMANPSGLMNLKNISGYSKIGGEKGLGRFLNPLNRTNPLLYDDTGKFSGRKAMLIGSGLLTASPFLMGGGEDDEDNEISEMPFSQTPDAIQDIVSQAQTRNPSLRFLTPEAYTQANFYNRARVANGGIMDLPNSGGAGEEQLVQMLKAEYIKYRQQGGTMPFEQFVEIVMKQQQEQQMAGPQMAEQQMMDPQQMTQPQMAAYGGRIGYEIGGDIDPADLPMSREGFPRYEDESGEEVPYPYNNQEMASNPDPMAELFQMYRDALRSGQIPLSTSFEQFKELMSSSSINESMDDMSLRENANLGGIMGYAYGPQNYRQMAAEGGRINFSNGGGPTKYIKDVLTKKGYQDMMQNMNDNEIRSLYDSVMGTFSRRFAEGGMIDLGGMEKDYRAEGGFVPIGGKEKADDVPARLSKNEFVFTADAVRNAGAGNIDEGAAVMQRMMDYLEQGGQISQESQGMNPAQDMYDTTQQLESRIA